MQPLAPTILANAKLSLEVLGAFSDRVVQCESGSGLHAESAISNAKLLLGKLVAFYSDDNNAAYFPHHADSDIHAPLSALAQTLTQFQAAQQPALANSAVAQADQLYTAAMRLGLVSFGFDANEIKEIVEELGAKRKYVKRTATAVEQKAAEIIAEAMAAQEAAAKALGVGNDIVSLREKLSAGISECAAEHDRLMEDAESIEKASDAVEERKAAIIAAADELSTVAAEVKADAKSAAESAKAGLAALDSIQQARANAKEEMDEITAFYGEIELHQKSMIDARKEAEAKFNDLNAKYVALQADYGAQTAKVIAQNQAIQQEIKTHLQKAVGASLFHAFDKRRTGLNFGKWVWAAVMLVAVIAGGGLSLWLAESLKAGSGSGLEPAFFVKLSAIIPVTFAIVFAAKQYANERRTEEEYAFKSAISLSLEPYKDLLQKMKVDGHEAQAAFVEKLLLEIFDNPVSRVHSDVDGRRAKIEKAMTLKDVKSIIAVSKDLDIEKVKQVVEILGGNFPKP
jgi:hypothetical protein